MERKKIGKFRESKKEKTEEESKDVGKNERADKAEEKNLENLLQEEKQNKQTKTIVFIMAFLMIAIFLTFWLIRESKKFEYAGLKFEKIMFDELPMYQAKIPITTITGQLIANYNLYLRNDPRKSNVSIEGEIRLMKNLILAVDESMPTCSSAGIAGVNLGQFMGATGIKSITGTTNLTKAINEDIAFANCRENTDDSVQVSVLIIKEANETKIIQKSKDCYIMEVANCEVLEATERFIVGAIAHSKGYEI